MSSPAATPGCCIAAGMAPFGPIGSISAAMSPATPAIVATGSDQVAILVRRSDGALGVIERSSGGWSNWLRIEARLASDPAASFAGGALHIAARTADDVLVEAIRHAGGAWGPWTRRDVAVTSNFDRRKTRILQIGTELIAPRAFDYPGEVSGGQLAIQATPGAAELAKGRYSRIEALPTQHLATVTAVTPFAAIAGEMTDHVLLSFSPPLPRAVSAAVVRANIANASHGETQPDEPLGHGDASKSFAEFTLQRAPLTFLPGSRADRRPCSTSRCASTACCGRRCPACSGESPARKSTPCAPPTTAPPRSASAMAAPAGGCRPARWRSWRAIARASALPAACVPGNWLCRWSGRSDCAG